MNMKSESGTNYVYTGPAENGPQAGLRLSHGLELTPDARPRSVESPPKRPRGFAAMDPRAVREIASKGGRAAHSAGTAHQFSSDEARAAGSKGGRASHAKRREMLEKRCAPQVPERGREGNKRER
jgi:general stress protein YciG